MAVTASELNLDESYTPLETSMILGALNLVTCTGACPDLLTYCQGKRFNGMPLDVLLHGLAEKESSFRLGVVGIEKDGTLAFGLFQFHYSTLLPFLRSQNTDLAHFLVSVPIQVESVVLLMSRDYDGKDVRTAFKEFGPHTRRITDALVDYEESTHA